jgi:threonine dehydrogenase-like Zn-dependent dehydrogenase
MEAITFDGAIPRYLFTRAAGAVSTRFLSGPGRCTFRACMEEPELPGPRWVKIRTRLGGVCGSDLNLVRLSVSPSASPFSSFPFVVGHENVGEVSAVGAGVTRVRLGDRVVANPLLPCGVRGIDPPCAQCAAGRVAVCEKFTEGELAPGMMIGTTRGLGGSWGEVFVAHEDRVHAVPDSISDEAALLLEPFATVLSPLLSDPPPGESVLVIGAGTIGLLATAALRALAPGRRVTVLARHAFQAERARELGADRVVRARGSDHFDELAAAGGGRLLVPILGKRVGVGGFDATMVCTGGGSAVEDALRFTRGGGRVVLLGNVARLPGVDWTPLWMKELTVQGSICYNGPLHGGVGEDAFERGLSLLSDGWAGKLGKLVTHRFRLRELPRALAISFGREQSGAVKVAFDLRG